jgi:glycosyltransferase involved in cell wall biosynthesis
MKKILFITDTWSEDKKIINGVITWLFNMRRELKNLGYEVVIVSPSMFKSFPLPTYNEIRISVFFRKKMEKIICEGNFNIIHIVTEGPLGFTAKRICDKHNFKYTSYYHTKFPEYINVRLKILLNTAYSYMHYFHKKSKTILVSTESLKNDLEKRNFKNLQVCTPGVDTNFFKRNEKSTYLKDINKPRFVFLGRIAPEKNLEAFLKCDLPGPKILIGDGPDRKKLENKYPNAKFLGKKIGQELVDILSTCDVFVLPSHTETFGLVVIEALACGLPVAGYDVVGLQELITDGKDGYLGDDLAQNAIKCLSLNKKDCVDKAMRYSWKNTALKFIALNS